MSKGDFDWRETVPRFYFLYNTLILIWVVLAILGSINRFSNIDSDKIIYISCMLFGSGLSVYYQKIARNENNLVNSGVISIYIVTWLGITAFSNPNENINYFIISTRLKNFEFLALFPILFMWLQTRRSEKFFGFAELGYRDRISWIWKSIIVILFIVNSLDLNSRLQFLILIPMIAEPLSISNAQKKELPTLTLFFNQEITEKLAIPISLTRSIFIILFSFMFGFLSSRLWVLILLGFMFAGFLWVIQALVSNFQGEDQTIKVEDYIENLNLDQFETTAETINLLSQQKMAKKASVTESIPSDIETRAMELKQSSSAIDLQSVNKAHKLGLKMRKELQKPRYNLNHILSTLSNEDFNEGFKVTSPDLTFNSLKGKWRPPINLILFPIDMSKYDFRRADEILLLGFNKPNLDPKRRAIEMTSRKKRKARVRFGKERIVMGDLTFNMNTLLIKKTEWETIKSSLTKLSWQIYN